MSASRREFLKVAGAGAASVALANGDGFLRTQNETRPRAILPRRQEVVVGCGDARMTHEQAKR
jgi:hypothetical protein